MSGISRAFGLLCEGYDSGLTPEVIYVQQGRKVCFLEGASDLCESALMEGVEVVESIDALELEERNLGEGRTVKTVKDGRWIVEGPFQRSNTKNANGRTYPRAIWERLVADSNSSVQKGVREGAMLGHLEHPKDGRTDGNDGALVTRKLTLRQDGVVWGVAELLDTPKGLILQEYTRKGVKWGVSSRGNGAVDDAGRVNESDFALNAFDGVMKPSTPGAFPTLMHAGKKNESNATESDVSEATTEADTGFITEQVQDLTEHVETLCETDIAGMSGKDQLAFTRRLVNSLSEVSSYVSSNALSPEKATELQDWLTKKLKAVHESVEVEATIDAALDEDLSQDDDEAAVTFKRVVSSLQERLTDATAAVTESDRKLELTKRAKVAVEEAARKRLAEAHSRVEAATTQAAEAEAALAEKESELESLQALLAEKDRELALACDLVAQSSAVDVRSPVEEAVADVLEDNPALAAFEDVLLNAPSVERVGTLAESLAVATSAPKPPVPVTRRSLPTQRLVEAEQDAGSRVLSTPRSRGARSAGAAVKQMRGGA